MNAVCVGNDVKYIQFVCKSNYTAPELRIRIHFIRIQIQHFRLNTDPDPGVLMTKNRKKNLAKTNFTKFY